MRSRSCVRWVTGPFPSQRYELKFQSNRFDLSFAELRFAKGKEVADAIGAKRYFETSAMYNDGIEEV